MRKRYIYMIGVIYFGVFSITTAQNYPEELQKAYNYAYYIGITTMPTIDQADMYGKLTRTHMAKMMVNYAKNILGSKPNTLLPCGFSDIDDQSPELQGYIMEACYMSLMGMRHDGSPNTIFNPNSIVTRAEFGTVLSRVIRGSLFNGATPYYQNHLQALKDAGIMTKIDKPTTHELRGWVMVTMMRAMAGDKKIELTCDTPENIFYCDISRSLGIELCPPECVLMGNVAAGTLSLIPFSQSFYLSSGVYLASLRIQAQYSPIKLNSFTFDVGTGWTSTTRFRLEQEGNRISGRIVPSNDNKVKLSLSNTLIKAGSTLTLHLIASKAVSNINILETSDIGSSALFVLGQFPLSIKR